MKFYEVTAVSALVYETNNGFQTNRNIYIFEENNLKGEFLRIHQDFVEVMMPENSLRCIQDESKSLNGSPFGKNDERKYS